MISVEYCKSLPKIELHAHLNGSLSEKTLLQLGSVDESVQEYSSLRNVLQKTDRTLDECFDLFKVAHNATNNAGNVYIAASNVIEEFYEDGVVYLELRTTPRAENGMSRKQYVQAVIKAVEDNMSNIIVKLILCIDRRHDEATCKEVLDVILEMKEAHPDLIVGIDLCGNPNEGTFNEQLFQKARENGLKITLHCAEVKNDEETLKMFQFKPERIGHGTCIHPDSNGSVELWKFYQQYQIPIEACMTSNVVCGTSSSYENHHVRFWKNHCLPFSLSTDDKGVFSTSLSKEYYNFATAFDCQEGELFKIALDCVQQCFSTDLERERLRIAFDRFDK